MMIVTETKTKVMVCGSASRDIVVKFNDSVLGKYKYLVSLMKSVKKKMCLVQTLIIYICAVKRNKQSLQFLND